MVGNYIVSFIGFLPADDPKVVVYIAIDNPKGITQYGGTVSAPIAKKVLQDCITALNIEKREGGTEKKYNYLDKKYVAVPNVVGMETKEALSNLKEFKVEFSGTGEKVIYQSPEEKTRIFEGETVRLMLGS